MKNRKIGRKPDRKIPVPKNDDVIVLTGLVHMETGRQFAFCTADGSEGFFLGAEDMASPDGGKDLVARCGECKAEAGGAPTHWIVDFRTALSEGRIIADDGGGGSGDHVLSNLSIVNNLVQTRGAGAAGRPAALRKAATS
jgi:hypothetical protein